MSDVFFAVIAAIGALGVLVAFVMTAQRAEQHRRSPGRHRPGAIAHRPCADITQANAEAVWTCSTT